MLFANGIGPIKRTFNRHFAGKTLNDLQAISLRDSESFNEIKAMGIKNPNIYVTSDPAILLEPACKDDVDKLMKSEGIPSNKPLIGFSIRKWADSSYLKQIAEVAVTVENFDAIRFIPMQYPVIMRYQAIRNRMEHLFYCYKIYTLLLLGLTGRFSDGRQAPYLSFIHKPVYTFIRSCIQKGRSILKGDWPALSRDH